MRVLGSHGAPPTILGASLGPHGTVFGAHGRVLEFSGGLKIAEALPKILGARSWSTWWRS